MLIGGYTQLSGAFLYLPGPEALHGLTLCSVEVTSCSLRLELGFGGVPGDCCAVPIDVGEEDFTHFITSLQELGMVLKYMHLDILKSRTYCSKSG